MEYFKNEIVGHYFKNDWNSYYYVRDVVEIDGGKICLVCDVIYLPNRKENIAKIQTRHRFGLILTNSWRKGMAGWKEITAEEFDKADKRTTSIYNVLIDIGLAE